jgi:hypothetical protein
MANSVGWEGGRENGSTLLVARYHALLPFSTSNPSALPLCPGPTSSFVVTPLAALAKEDMAVADNGGMSSIPGGGFISTSRNVPFSPTGTGSPPAVTGRAVMAVAKRASSVALSSARGSDPFDVAL